MFWGKGIACCGIGNLMRILGVKSRVVRRGVVSKTGFRDLEIAGSWLVG